MKSIDYSVEAVTGLAPQEQATAQTVLGSAIDRMNFDDGRLVAQVGSATGTPDSESHVFTVKECATSGGAYTAVSGVTLTFTAAGIADIEIPDMHKRLRYLKVQLVTSFVGGTTPKNKFSAILELGRKVSEPVA